MVDFKADKIVRDQHEAYDNYCNETRLNGEVPLSYYEYIPKFYDEIDEEMKKEHSRRVEEKAKQKMSLEKTSKYYNLLNTKPNRVISKHTYE